MKQTPTRATLSGAGPREPNTLLSKEYALNSRGLNIMI